MRTSTFVALLSFVVMSASIHSISAATPSPYAGRWPSWEVAMSNSNGKITAPINIASDVYKVLGLSPNKGAYGIGYACSNEHERTNIWAKHKPVRHPNIGVLSAQQLKDTFYGLNPQSENNNVNAIPPKIICEPWTYEPPRGGEKEPYRIADFDGYNHNALCPARLDTYEIEFDKSINDINGFAIQGQFCLYDKNNDDYVYYGLANFERKDVEIGLNEFPILTQDGRSLYWGLAYIEGNTIYVANSESNMDIGANSEGSYLPAIIMMGKWQLGDIIMSKPAGTTMELIPIINPVRDGSPNGLTKNGNISEDAICFPEGKKLVIKIKESPTGALAQASWSFYSDIIIYYQDSRDLIREAGNFKIGAGTGGKLSQFAASTNVYLEASVSVGNKTNGTLTVRASEWILDFSNYPCDEGYNLGRLQCNGARIGTGESVSSSVEISSKAETVVYFRFSVTQSQLMNAFFKSGRYFGPIALENNAYSQQVTIMTFNINPTW